MLDNLRRRVEIDKTLVDLELVAIPCLGTLTTRSLTGSDLQDLGGKADGALDTEVLVLGTVDEVTREFLEVRNIAAGQSNTDFVELGGHRGASGIVVFVLRDVLRYDLKSNLDICNQILHMYGKWGCIDAARIIFESMMKKDLVTWTIMMMNYMDYGHAGKALLLFQQMQYEGEKPDSTIIITLLKAHMELGHLIKVKEIHNYIYRILLLKDSAIMNSIIIAYAKCGRLDLSKVVFDSNSKESLSSWNTMIASYGVHGNAEEVLRLFHEMQRHNIRPDAMTYTSVLSACSHSGLVEESWQVFKALNTDHNVSPSEEHYNCMVDLLGRAGQLDQAYNLVKHSPLKDRTSALCALLGACKIHKNTKLGEFIGKKLLEIEPHNPGIYSLVSNIYSEAYMWIKATSLRNEARTKGLRKTPGFSLIKLDGYVGSF